MLTKFNKSLQEILVTDNLITLFSESEKEAIKSCVKSCYDEDLKQSKDVMDDMEKFTALSMQITEKQETNEGGTPKPDTCIPIIFKAAVNFLSDAMPAILKDGNITNFKPVGNDKDIMARDAQGNIIKDPQTGEDTIASKGGQKLAKAQRLAEFENYIILKKMFGFVDDLRKFLIAFPICGMMYRKTYKDNYKRRPIDEIVYPNKIVINPCAKNMIEYPFSHIIQMTQNSVYEKMATGQFAKYDMDILSDSSDSKENQGFSKENKPVPIIEQYCFFDFDGDGYKEPYIVTITIDGKYLLNISKRFIENGIVKEGYKVLCIEPIEIFTAFSFVPDPRGGFHGVGLGYLLYKINKAQNTTLNQLILGGIRSNQDKGFFDKNAIEENEQDIFTLKDSEYQGIGLARGKTMQDIFYQFPAKEASQTLYNLLMFLIDVGKETANLSDVMQGEIPMNAMPTTVLTMLQRGMKDFKEVYRAFLNNFTKELSKIHEIIKNSPELYAELYLKVLDPENPKEINFEKDYDDNDVDVEPCADPEIVLSSEKLGKASLLMQFIGNPVMDQMELMKKILEYCSFEDIDKLIVKQNPNQVDPATQLLLMEQQNKSMELQLKAQEMEGKLNKMALEMQQIVANIQKTKTASMVDLAKVSKIGNDIEDAAAEREVKVMDNIIDAQTKQIEVKGRLEDNKIKHMTEIAKLKNEQIMQEKEHKHQKEIKDKETLKISKND